MHRTPTAHAPHALFRCQASPDDLAGVGESSRASAAPRAANPGGEWTTPVPAGAASTGPSALESLIDTVARQEGGDGSDLSSLTQGLRSPLDQSNRRSRRNSREITGLDAVPESTAGLVGGDATPLAALAPSPLGPSPLPAINRTAGPPPVSSA